MKITIGGSLKKSIDWSKPNILKFSEPNNDYWFIVLSECIYNNNSIENEKHFGGTILHPGNTENVVGTMIDSWNKKDFELYDLEIILIND